MSTGAEAVSEKLGSGEFLRPDWQGPNPVALARAISSIGGHSPWREDPATEEIRQRIGDPDHLVVVIVDGFGMNFVESLPVSSFSRTHVGWQHPTVFPSSTGPAMTSLFTGFYPASHGFTGWWVHLPQLGERVTVYEWVRESDGTDLSSLGIKPGEVFLERPFPGQLHRDTHLIFPSQLRNSLPTRHSEAGGAPIAGYDGIEHGIDVLLDRLRPAAGPTTSVLYWNMVDTAAHEHGADALETHTEVHRLDGSLGQLASAIDGNTRLVVTADHGHLDVSVRLLLGPEHPLSGRMKCVLSGETRVAYFHLIDSDDREFDRRFTEEFGSEFLLVDTTELVELHLLGPAPPSAEVMQRLGDRTAIARNDAILNSRGPGSSLNSMASTHGGLTPQEMLVPVLLA